MRFRQAGRALNWRVAVGEVILIVIGITLALAASDYYQGRVDREDELVALRELRGALVSDREVLAANLDSLKLAAELLTDLQAHLHAEMGYSDSLDAYFGAMYGLRITFVNAAPYESIKSRGLDLVSSDSLRALMTSVYDLRFSRLDEMHRTQRSVVLEALRPYFLTHFKDLEFNRSATPLDYSFVVSDQTFLNLLDYRLQVLEAAEIPLLRLIVADVERLMEALDGELGL